MNTCPVYHTTHLLGEKWAFVLLEDISHHPGDGFNALLKRMKKVSPKILSQRLKDLEEQLLITKATVSQQPLNTSYTITLKGKELINILSQLKKWHDHFSLDERKCVTPCTDCAFY